MYSHNAKRVEEQMKQSVEAFNMTLTKNKSVHFPLQFPRCYSL